MFYLLLFFLVNFAYSCLQVVPDSPSAPIKQLQVRSHIEFFFQDETLLTEDTYFTIYYYQDWTLYKFRHHFDSIVNDKPIKEGYINSYFVFRKGDQYGFQFDPNKSYRNGSYRVDSLLDKYALGNFTWDQITDLKAVKSYDSATGVLEEIYGPSSDSDTNKDTMKFYYSNRFKEYEFSFSKKLDSLKKMKLFKIVIQNAPFYYEQLKKQFPKRESYFVMEEGKDTDLKLVEHYFREYKKMKQPNRS